MSSPSWRATKLAIDNDSMFPRILTALFGRRADAKQRRMFLARSLLRVNVARCYASVATAAGSTSAQDILAKINADHARVLRVVQNRVAEREKLTAEVNIFFVVPLNYVSHFLQLSDEMSSPEDIDRLRHIKESERLADAWALWTRTHEQLKDTSALLADPDPAMRGLAADEITALAASLNVIAKETFPALLVPPSPTAALSALMELKSGVGGSEASLFLADMLRMYQRLATNMKWRATVVASNSAEGGGTKDAVVEIVGAGAYDALRWESGVHRVQRVPATEASGRTHTSTVAIVVRLPFALTHLEINT